LAFNGQQKAIEEAVRKVLDLQDLGGLGLRTKDLGGTVNTVTLGDKVVETLRSLL